MPRGSKPGERRGGRQKGTPNKKTVLKNALFGAAVSGPDTLPLDFMLGLMRNPAMPLELRLEMAVAAASYVHAKPQALPGMPTSPASPTSLQPHPSAAQSNADSTPPKMDEGLKRPDRGQENGVGENGVWENRVGEPSVGEGVGAHSGINENRVGVNGAGANGLGEHSPGGGVGGYRAGETDDVSANGAAANGVGAPSAGATNGTRGNGASDEVANLTPLQFMLGVMKDDDAPARLRIRAARVAARYTYAPPPPPTLNDGFSIDRALADAIKEDWFAFRAIDVVKSELAPRYSELLARRTERDEFLTCPPGYSPKRDLERRAELLGMNRNQKQETELAFVIARITASEAAFNRSPEGRARRRIDDLLYRREAADYERNRLVGLTRAEGKELDELLKQYKPKGLRPWSPIHKEMVGHMDRYYEGQRRRYGPDWRHHVERQKRPLAVVRRDPDEMEELPPTQAELDAREFAEKAALIERRKAEGHPDPWDGKAPRITIHDLEKKRYLGDELSPAEEKEWEQLSRVYVRPDELASEAQD